MKSSTIKKVRHIRVMELRNMALHGAKLEQLRDRANQWGVGKQTVESYIEEVIESIQKMVAKQRKRMR